MSFVILLIKHNHFLHPFQSSDVEITQRGRARLQAAISGPHCAISQPDPLAKSGVPGQIRPLASDKKMGKPNIWFAHFNKRRCLEGYS